MTDLLHALAGIALALYVGCTVHPDRATCAQPSGNMAIVSRIWCTGGTRPIVVDARTVGCMR